MPEFRVKIYYLNQLTLKCPICDVCYSFYSRHITATHPDAELHCQFKCTACEHEFLSRRSVAHHCTKIHGKFNSTSRTRQDAGTLVCEFCDDRFRSMGQHIRNQHAAEASKQHDTQAATSAARFYTPREHQWFVEALSRFGRKSNIAIAKHISTEFAKLVSMHKRIFLRENPEWLSTTQSIDTSTSETNSEIDCDPLYSG